MKGIDTVKKHLKHIFIGIATGVANGLFGSGGGIIAVSAMVLVLKAEEHKAHATAILIILPLTVLSAFFYIRGSFIDWNMTVKVIIGGVAGGYIGARILDICPAGILRKVFAAFMILAAFRMII